MLVVFGMTVVSSVQYCNSILVAYCVHGSFQWSQLSGQQKALRLCMHVYIYLRV